MINLRKLFFRSISGKIVFNYNISLRKLQYRSTLQYNLTELFVHYKKIILHSNTVRFNFQYCDSCR